MSLAEDRSGSGDGDDILAAEYVVGVLSAEERAAAARRIDADPAFARLAEAWEARLSPLSDAYPEVSVPARVKDAIDRRLGLKDIAGATRSERAGWWSSLVLWRGLAGIAVLALAVALATPYVLDRRAPVEQTMMMASLSPRDSDVQYLAMLDTSKGQLGLSHVSGERAPDHDFELWMIGPDQAPVSMGVIPVGSSMHMPLDGATMAKLSSGTVLAISLEPRGGSPTGSPTGPVVAAGDMRQI